jgi:hypothetical protein
VIVRGVTMPPGAGVLGDHEGAVRLRLDDRVPHVEHRRHALPVGEVAARRLGAALEDVSGGDAGREPVPIVPGPAELVRERGQDERGVGGTAGHDDARPAAQRFGDRTSAQVGIGGDDAPADLRERARTVHVVETGTVGLERVEPRQQVVAAHHADRQRHARLLAQGVDGLRTPGGIDAPGIHDHGGAALEHGRQGTLELLDEVVRKARARIARTLALQDHHGDLGEEIHGDVVDRSTAELTEQRLRIVSPVPAGVGDAHGRLHPLSPSDRLRSAGQDFNALASAGPRSHHDRGAAQDHRRRSSGSRPVRSRISALSSAR